MRKNHCTSLNVYQHKLEEEKEENCRLCKEKVETSEHLICECPVLEGRRMEEFHDKKVEPNMMVEDPEKCRKILSKVFSELAWDPGGREQPDQRLQPKEEEEFATVRRDTILGTQIMKKMVIEFGHIRIQGIKKDIPNK